ncbi:MAG TPA: hypothetical protein VLL49_01225 [Anaerolineales bacterium]|nr:hypothetical protein [Anaerolineales bacterium]
MPAPPRSRPTIFLISTAVLLPTLAFLLLHIFTPSDGARMLPGYSEAWQPNGIQLTPYLPDSSPLQAGDLLIAVDGQELNARVATLLRFGPAVPRPAFGQTLAYTVIRAGQTIEVPVTLGRFPLGAVLGEAWPSFVVVGVVLFVGAFLHLMRPAEPIGGVTLFGAAALASNAAWSFGLQVSDLLDGWGFWLFKFCTVVGYLWIWGFIVHVVLLFPKPHPVLARRRALLVALYSAPLGLYLIYAALARPAGPTLLAWIGRMDSDLYWLALGHVALAGYLAISRSRMPLDPISRLQVRWILSSLIFVSLTALLLGFVPEVLRGAPLLPWNGILLSGLVVPLALMIAVLRYRLFDIDLIINRTLVYVPLTALLAGAYTASIKLFQVFFVTATGNESDAAIVMTTLILAAAFTPVRNALQSSVDRRFRQPYGPARELQAFDRQVHAFIEALDPSESVRRLLQLSVQASGRRGGAIYLRSGGREALVHATPDWAGKESLRIPLEWEGTRLGRLSLGPPGSELARPAVPTQDLEASARRVAQLVHLVRRSRGRSAA